MGKGFLPSKQQQNTKGGTQTMGWEEQCIDIYETPCITAGDPGVEVCQDPIKVGEECGPVWVDDPVEPEDPEPGGDPCDDPANFWMCNPDPNDPDDESPPVDCAGVPFGTAYESECGCIGGTTGIEECPENPCDQINNLKNKTFFNNIMNNLRANATGNFEGAYAFKSDGTSQYAQGANGQHFVSMGITNPIDGYIHNHFAGGDPMFSSGDIELLKVLFDNNKIIDLNTFTMGVTTAQGTEYLLKINDVSQFSAFMNMVGNSTQFNNWSNSYYSKASQYQTINQLSQIAAFEKAFLEEISGKGIQLFKKDNSGNYNPIKESGGNVVPDPCI